MPTESMASSESKRMAEKVGSTLWLTRGERVRAGLTCTQYDSHLDQEVRNWLSAVADLPVDHSTPLCEELKSGVVLCK